MILFDALGVAASIGLFLQKKIQTGSTGMSPIWRLSLNLETVSRLGFSGYQGEEDMEFPGVSRK